MLLCPTGKYEGSFKNGLKHGAGEFVFRDGLKYAGQYVEGVRQGSGMIFKRSGNMSFCGEIRNGLPNGRGYIVTSDNEHLFTRWCEGIDEKVLPVEFINEMRSKSEI